MTAPQDADIALAYRGVDKAFGAKVVLRGLDLAIRRGETFTILGGSGSGKSVTLKLANGLMRPDAGSIRVEGQDVTRLPERELVGVRKICGMVFQGAALFDSLTVYENVAYPLREHLRLPERELEERVARCLGAVGLPGTEALMPNELSGGMRKRVGLARSLALEPRIILYDEPTTGLDPGNSRRIGELIREMQRSLGVTSVVVTHDLDLCWAVSDRAGLIADGRIVVQGEPDAVRGSSHPAWREFLEGAPVSRSGGGREVSHGT